MSIKLNEKQLIAVHLLASGVKASIIAKDIGIREETLSRWRQIDEFKFCLQKTQEKVLESIIETQKHILILSQDIIIQTLKNETLDDLKKAMVALRYISLIRGKHNIEDKYTKRLSDLSFNNTFGFE
jgi:hypothetical protein